MKNFLLWTLTLGLLASAALPAAAQTVLVGTGTPNASAALDVQSTNQGLLVPRMLAGQRTGITNAATGLLVYQTDAIAGFYCYDGSAWSQLGGSSGGPTLPSQAGNAGKVLTTDGSNLSWTGYNKETLTVVRLTGAALAYTVPPFTSGVNSQTIVFLGVWNSNANVQSIAFPNPATVPDGTRITMKRLYVAGSDNNSGSLSQFVVTYSGWTRSTSGIDGAFNTTGSGTYALNNPANNTSAGNTSAGNTARFAITFVKITHYSLTTNSTSGAAGTTLYSDWIPLAGWKE